MARWLNWLQSAALMALLRAITINPDAKIQAMHQRAAREF
jgi:hypothetical protein